MFPKRVVHTNYALGMLQNVCSIKITFLLLWASHEVPLDLLIELNSVFLLLKYIIAYLVCVIFCDNRVS